MDAVSSPLGEVKPVSTNRRQRAQRDLLLEARGHRSHLQNNALLNKESSSRHFIGETYTYSHKKVCQADTVLCMLLLTS